ncbi:hypothetical protein D9M68_230000 [compost metagenome]
MTHPSSQALFLHDALARVIANPTASHCWHDLATRYFEADEALRIPVVQALQEDAPAEGLPGFFRATLLASGTNDAAYIGEAARLIQTIEPLDPDRLATFSVFEWSRTLQGTNDCSGFIRALRHARLHEIASRLGKHLLNGCAVRPSAREISEVRRVALIAPYISTASHTPTSMALHQARLLIGQGLSVHLFACQELKVPQMPHYLGYPGHLLIAPPDVEELRGQANFGPLCPPPIESGSRVLQRRRNSRYGGPHCCGAVTPHFARRGRASFFARLSTSRISI